MMTTLKPVVIAGAGPTGLMCALALRAQDIPVVLLEAEEALTHDLRAGSFHPPTLEMMAPYGITERMHESGIKVRHWQIRNRPGDLVAEFDLDLLRDVTPYPYRLHLEQHRLTPIQLDLLRQEGGAEIHFGHSVKGFTRHADGVTVTTGGPSGDRRFEASWLIGADGGRSVVRKGLGVEFEGFTWPELFVVASTPYDFGAHGFAYNCYIADPVEFGALFKVPDAGPPGLWRLAYPVNPHEADEVLLSEERVEAALQRVLPKHGAYDIRYKSTYRVHQRVAASFRSGRVLLAGDAAHLNNPLGGFGLNSGIHDAVNLCEKLGRHWRGEGEHLLDLYSRQRRFATIEQVQAMSIRNKRMMEERDPAVQRRHLEEMVAVATDPDKARAHLLNTSMILGLKRASEVI
ncbi:MAG: FAD-dependent monooxygenase [Proteobacteria bacterium]|nr:FAD-dependent monooxygenase [Pseudomonadota bacterium]